MEKETRKARLKIMTCGRPPKREYDASSLMEEYEKLNATCVRSYSIIS